jgi:RsiW-degrading membrane proteinase PrsW (M82 family)
MDRRCTNCGAELPPGAAFCAVCGKPVSGAPQRVPSLPAGPARNNYKLIRWALWAAAILVMCVLGLAGLAFVGGSLGIFLIAGAMIAVLPVPLYLALALWLDRYEKEPIGMLAVTFLWGATVAIFFSGIINTIGGAVVGAFLGANIGGFFTAVISAPIVEESTKALALLILFFWKKDEFDGVVDGIVYAAMVGLGFAMVENFIYYGRALAGGGIAEGALTFGIRGVFSPFSHPVFTSMTGIGLGLARQSNNTFVKFAAPLAGLTGAIVLHAIWNGSSYVLGGGLGLLFLLFIYTPFLIIAVLAVSFFALSREGRVIRQYLTPELQSGLITRREYDALGSVSGRLDASFRALSSRGFGGWRAYSRFSQTATELAFHRDRVQRGITSVDATQREAAYVHLLRDLRGQMSSI